ncbi:AAA family ATPase [Actinomyces sp. oral taxon 175]|uniref:AAA family ATPase n=1 Tax=Actinomyces sp. oral taxon 175 TaxID=712119 RepID=UPI00021D0F84|nr:AAA family ATPase [Actinomyces sp. oral taxon 175]EGV11541.1 ATPase, AAA family [Actinomyces sp. oral taxon 175 str. F0384]
MTDPLIESLTRAVEATPDDIRLRTHLAELLVEADRNAEAVTHCAVALQYAPTDERARTIMARALSLQAAQPPVGQPAEPAPSAASPVDVPDDSPTAPEAPAPSVAPSAPSSPAAPAPKDSTASDDFKDFDWQRAEKDFDGGPAAPFVSSESSEKSSGSDPALSESHLVSNDNYSLPGDWEVERADICLADVGGMVEVKNRLEASFLAPMRNPELRRLYGKSLRGGLLLYGPPGTGKTFIARAIAGEMGAGFLSVTLTDILDHYMGISENNLHRIFQKARNHAPCVLFLDEIDALGIKRSLTRNSGMRSVVNQLLEELDGIGNDNDGVYILAATNTPWDIDPALRRPGRLDRTLLVLPPDEPARATILHTHLRERPVEGIDLQVLARMTEGLTGADLSHVCDSAAEKALIDSVRTGRPRLMNMQDMYAAVQEVRPSTGPWFETARTVIEYADSSGEYADLREWMKRHRML